MITPPCSFIIGFGFMLICLSTTCSTTPFECEKIHFAVSRHKEYHFISTFKLSWQKANEYCRSRGLFLVSIQNQEQFDAVKAVIDGSGYWNKHQTVDVWTSLNDIGEEGHYYWATTGVRNTFDCWKAGEPNNVVHNNCTDEDCVALIKHKVLNIPYSLDDRPCTDEFYFMCESMDC